MCSHSLWLRVIFHTLQIKLANNERYAMSATAARIDRVTLHAYLSLYLYHSILLEWRRKKGSKRRQPSNQTIYIRTERERKKVNKKNNISIENKISKFVWLTRITVERVEWEKEKRKITQSMHKMLMFQLSLSFSSISF